jgi:hypothetical protein
MWLGSDDGPICAHNASFEHCNARVLVVSESSLGKEAKPNAVAQQRSCQQGALLGTALVTPT